MKFFLLASILLTGITCNNNDNQINCDTIACTEQFISHSVKITDQAGNPIALDSINVSELLSGDDLTVDYSIADLEQMQVLGEYLFYSDLFVQKHQQKSLDIVFKGFIDQNEITSQIYKVGADCCHTSVISGDLLIIVN